MAPRSRGINVLVDTITKSSIRKAHVCRSCQQSLSMRNYASAATAQATADEPHAGQSSTSKSETVPFEKSKIAIHAGIVLSRPPLITADPHPFETAFYLYQRRLNERLVLPFMQYFYYRKGTPSFENWKKRREQRGGIAARDIGKYNAYTKESWNDEVLMGDQSANPRKLVEQLIDEEGRTDEFSGEKGDKKVAGLRRTTEADTKNDQRSLERSLSKTLYLLVKRKALSKDAPENTLWNFPSGSIQGKESLKDGAQRILDSSCGVNMNTWFVGNHPVGHYTSNLKALDALTTTKAKAEPEVEEEKTFFMKARIMAGQADPKGAASDIQDFKWLAKEEIEKTVSPRYWSSIKNMLVDQ